MREVAYSAVRRYVANRKPKIRVEAGNLLVTPGTEWFPAEPSGPFIRLHFSGEDPTRFPAAGEVLGYALRPLM